MPRKTGKKYIAKVVDIVSRRARGDTQEKIAADLGTTIRAVSRAERAFRLGLLPLASLPEVVQDAYDDAKQEKVRAKLLGMLTRLAVATATQSRSIRRF